MTVAMQKKMALHIYSAQALANNHFSGMHACTRRAWPLTALPGWLQVGRVKAHCMFTGSTDSPMYRWLAGKGITLILVRFHRKGCGMRVGPLTDAL